MGYIYIYIYGWGYIGNVIIPTDFHSIIFQRGRSTTNQLLNTGIFHCHACPPALRDGVVDTWARCPSNSNTQMKKVQLSLRKGTLALWPQVPKNNTYMHNSVKTWVIFLTRLCCIQYTQLLYGHITIGFEISITAGEPCLFLVVSLVISELCQLVFYCENLIYPLPLDDCAPYRAHGTHGDPC